MYSSIEIREIKPEILFLRKVKILNILFLLTSLFCFTEGVAQEQSQENIPDSLEEKENRYTQFSECLQQVFIKADSAYLQIGPQGEIDLLKANRETCGEASPVTRRIGIKYLEWGDNIYNKEVVQTSFDKKDLFKEGLVWSRKGLKEDTTDHYNYEAMSMAYAAVLSVSGLRTKAKLADSVRVYAEECVRLNPKNDRAYHILGRWHYEVSKLGWLTKFLSKLIFREEQDGSFEKAAYYFYKAIELDNIPTHRYWLGLAYLETGEKEKALNEFKTLLDLPIGQHNDQYFKDKAKDLIEKHS